jgi:hypothetical protein
MAVQVPIAKHALFTVVPARILHLERGTCKDLDSIREIEARSSSVLARFFGS